MIYSRFPAKNPHFLDCLCQCEDKRQRLQRVLASRFRPKDLPIGLSQTTRSFHVTGKLPWSTTKDSHEVEYSEFQGHGPPCFFGDRFGDVGDIYIDLTPEKHCIYARVSKAEWVIWPGPLFVLNGVHHPAYPNYRLWCKIKGQSSDIGWHPYTNGVVADYNFPAHETIKKAPEMQETRTIAPSQPAKRSGSSVKRNNRRSEIPQKSKKTKVESSSKVIESPSSQNATHISAPDNVGAEPAEQREHNPSNESAAVGSESPALILTTENSASKSCAEANAGPTISMSTIYRDTSDAPQHRLSVILQTNLTVQSADSGSVETTESTSQELSTRAPIYSEIKNTEPSLPASSTSGSPDRPAESPIEATNNFEDSLDGIMPVPLEEASISFKLATAVDFHPNSTALDYTIHQEHTFNDLASLSPTSSLPPIHLNSSLAPSIMEETRNKIESTEVQWMPSISDEPNVILLTPTQNLLTSSGRLANDEVAEQSVIVGEYGESENVARVPPWTNSNQNIAVGQEHSDSMQSRGDSSKRQGTSLAESRINELSEVTVAPLRSGPSRPQLKEVHLSILFVEYSGRMLCRICLASNTRIFEFKPNPSHDTLAMLEHCLREHAEDCEALVNMSEKDLQELCGRLTAGAS